MERLVQQVEWDQPGILEQLVPLGHLVLQVQAQMQVLRVKLVLSDNKDRLAIQDHQVLLVFREL